MKKHSKKIIVITLMTMFGIVAISNAIAQEMYDGGYVYRDAKTLSKLEVSVYMDAEDAAEEEAILMLGIKKKFVKGQTFGFAFIGDSTTISATYKLGEKNRINKRVPFGLFCSKEEFKRMTNENIEWVLIADDWYALTPTHQAYIRKWANVYYKRYYEI